MTDFNIGDEVYYTPQILGGDGSYAEYHVADESIVAHRPRNISHFEAASLSLTGGTAWEALVTRGKLQVGESVLIHAGAGGVGSIAIQLAKTIGAYVFTSCSKQNTGFVSSLGADCIIDYRSEDYVEVIRRETSGKGVDFVFDTIGGDTIERSPLVMSEFGRLATIVDIPQPQSLLEHWGKNTTVYFIFTQQNRAKLDSLRVLIEREQVKPLIDSVRSLKPMKVHFLQHVPFEGLGSIEDWLSREGAILTSTKLFQEKKLPEIQQLDFIIAGPGPMSVNDEADLPWLKTEKLFLRDAIKQGVPVLGICLGAQLIASSLGARVYPNSLKEIGWFPIQAVPESGQYFQFPPECNVFHWHGETFELPEGAVRLVRSPACENQGFQLGRNVIGLQFHLETTPKSVGPLIENSRHEMTPGPYVQSEAEIKATPAANYAAINSLMNNMLNYLVRAE